MNLREGAILQGGKYRIERELGHGGFGVTYLATQVGLNRKVAIKEFFMSEYCNRDADTSQVTVGSEGSKELVAKFRTKFIKEAQNIACLKHPHIISIYDVFEDNGTAYYVMEYLEHGSLADLVKRQGRLSEADALRYTRQIADALCYIHARKMNHLDVKPGNILIDETDHAVLIDFGLSKRYDDEGNQTSTTPVGISHGYAPLEQYKKSGVGTFSPATDIYSLGATLYKLVTGTTPPDANDVSEDGLPAFPSFVSSTVAAAIEQAMQPRRKDRPQTVDAFLALLDAETKVDDERTVLDGYPLRPSGSSPLKRDSAALAEEDVEDKHSKKALSPFKGDERSGARHNVAEGVNNEAEPTLIWKKLLLPVAACIAVVLAVVLWPKGGDTSVKEEERQEILPPAGRQNDTNQQQTVQTQSQQQSQQQSQPTKPIKEEPAVPATTPLYVTTTPSGVTVYVDGKRVGTTPIEDKEIARGSHKVKLSKEGYEDKTLTRTFADKAVTINETLVVIPSTTPLYVTTTPSGAAVYVDGKKVGTTPIEDKEIARGSHKVKLSKEGYEEKTFTRTFGDKPMVINETLAEKPKPQPQQSSASSVTTSGNKKTYTVNGVSFTMVRVAGGTFTMGASSGDSEADSDEKPAHQVTLSSYSIGETEVTQALWQAVMGSNPSNFKGNLQRPVEEVSWNDCHAFIRKLNSLTGATFRLPTEAEWEYAARGGSHSRGYKYSGSNDLGTVAWYNGNSSGTTHPVKGKQPNELGLYDMSGNVWEWCADWYDSSYYSSSPSSNPKGPSAGFYRVGRGGSWVDDAGNCRVSLRGYSRPPKMDLSLGLRLVSQ